MRRHSGGVLGISGEIGKVISGLGSEREAQRFALNLAIAFIAGRGAGSGVRESDQGAAVPAGAGGAGFHYRRLGYFVGGTAQAHGAYPRGGGHALDRRAESGFRPGVRADSGELRVRAPPLSAACCSACRARRRPSFRFFSPFRRCSPPPATSSTRSARCFRSTTGACGRRFCRGLRFRLPVRALVTALYFQPRFHAVRLVPHRFRAGGVGYGLLGVVDWSAH